MKHLRALSFVLLISLTYAKSILKDDVDSSFEESNRVKRQSEADQQKVMEEAKYSQWRADYYNFLLTQTKEARKREQSKLDKELEERKKVLENILLTEGTKTSPAPAAAPAPVELASLPTRASAPVLHAAPLLPIGEDAKIPLLPDLNGTNTFDVPVEMTKIQIRIPVTLYEKLTPFFERYNTSELDLTPEEIILLEEWQTTTTTTTTTTPAPHKYLSVEVPESLYHKMWRFFKKFGLRRPDPETKDIQPVPPTIISKVEKPVEEETPKKEQKDEKKKEDETPKKEQKDEKKKEEVTPKKDQKDEKKREEEKKDKKI